MPTDRGSAGERGLALVIVLWGLLLLSLIAASLLVEVRAARTVSATERARLQAMLAADGTINRVILSLLDPRDTLSLPMDGSTQIVGDVGQDVVVRVESEAGKIDLNAAPRPLLTALFRTHGASAPEAEVLATRVVAWRSAGSDMRDADAAAPYAEAGRRYGPRLAPFRSTGELRLVLGMNDELLSAVMPCITVWSGEASLDRSVARTEVLRTLEEAGDALAGSERMAREAGVSGIPGRPGPGQTVTIVARVDTPSIRLERRAAVQIAGDRREPYRILGWQ